MQIRCRSAGRERGSAPVRARRAAMLKSALNREQAPGKRQNKTKQSRYIYYLYGPLGLRDYACSRHPDIIGPRPDDHTLKRARSLRDQKPTTSTPPSTSSCPPSHSSSSALSVSASARSSTSLSHDSALSRMSRDEWA